MAATKTLPDAPPLFRTQTPETAEDLRRLRQTLDAIRAYLADVDRRLIAGGL